MKLFNARTSRQINQSVLTSSGCLGSRKLHSLSNYFDNVNNCILAVSRATNFGRNESAVHRNENRPKRFEQDVS